MWEGKNCTPFVDLDFKSTIRDQVFIDVVPDLSGEK